MTTPKKTTTTKQTVLAQEIATAALGVDAAATTLATDGRHLGTREDLCVELAAIASTLRLLAQAAEAGK